MNTQIKKFYDASDGSNMGQKQLSKKETILNEWYDFLSDKGEIAADIACFIADQAERMEADAAPESDAVEFKDWCDSGKAWFFDNQEEHTHTTEELYKLFKNKQ